MFLESFTLIVILEFIANLYSFNFLIEFMLVPVLVVIVGMSVLANMKDEHRIIRKPLNAILATYGFFVLFHSIRVAVGDIDNFLSLQNILSFVIVPILSVAFVPLVYVFSLVMAYETLYLRLGIFIKNNPDLLSYSRKKIFLTCSLNLPKLSRFARSYTTQFMNIKSRKEVLELIETFSKNN